MRSDQDVTRRCAIGLLVVDAFAGAQDDRLKAAKHQTERELREKYGQSTREALKELSIMRPYVEYYKAFGYTYHVLLQLESVARGKAIPDALPPIRAMFMAELKNGILTAGHDLEKVRLPIRCMVSDGGEAYSALGGKAVTCVRGDRFVADPTGVLSSMLRGPDQRTAITGQTRRILYTAYAPDGVPEPALLRHLADIEALLRPDSDASPCFRKVVRAEAADTLLLDAGEL
jgi:DNA/RNA-binding domain of Phe-tRNA-synthetase-like protein